MAIILTIGGIDRTDKIQAKSLTIENILTNKRDTCKFNIMSYAGNAFTPVLGQEVVVTLDGTKVFGGVITELDLSSDTYAITMWSVICQDYTRLLDKRLVSENYQNMTGDQVIADMISRYTDGSFTVANVNCPVLIKSVTFNYMPVSKCLEEMARLTSYDWYVDYDKDIHFFSKDFFLAPFNINDDDGSHTFESLIIRKDNSQLRNSIVVRGGEYVGTQFTSEIECNGVDTIFPLAYKYKDFSATLTGEKLNVGIDNIDDADTHDALYNFTEKIIKFRDSRMPSNGAVMRIGGKPYLPVIVKLKSQTSIDSTSSVEGGDGIYEYLIVDKSIESKEGARQRATAELATYATTLSEGEFETEMAGLKAGMKIHIISSSRNIDENYVINKVTFKEFTKSTFVYRVSLVTTKTYDLIDLLVNLLLAETKKIVISEDEVVDLVESANETIGVSELFTAQSLDYPVEFVAGTITSQIPEGYHRIFIVGGSPLA